MRKKLLFPVALLLVGVCALPLPRLYWNHRSANPVRRGWDLAKTQGCFVCHGSVAVQGISDPGLEESIPGWNVNQWRERPRTTDALRQFILLGHPPGESGVRGAALPMPAYENRLNAEEVSDLTAMVLVLSGIATPAPSSPAARGLKLAERWDCFSCHGPAGAGGVPNPGSFTGRVPGWYGAEFRHLVHDRGEFEQWVRGGRISRLADAPLARYFQTRQVLQMPPYRRMKDADVEDLWAYTRWLNTTEGGIRPWFSSAEE